MKETRLAIWTDEAWDDDPPRVPTSKPDWDAYLTEREIGTLRGRISAYLRECHERREKRVRERLAKVDKKRAALEAEAARLRGEA